MVKRLIVLAGATASGKTSLAIDLATHLHCEIISCDARQFYKELNIGVAKPSDEQLEKIKHHCISHQSITNNYTVADFEKEALSITDNLFEKNDYIILCGGSGLYIDALCNGLDDMPAISEEVKKQVADLSIEECLSIIKGKDETYFNEMDQQNTRRVQRATEVILETKLPFSCFRKGEKKQRNFEILKFAIDIEREKLYENINQRVDDMIIDGLENEAKELTKLLPNKNLDTIGYREFFDFFENKISKTEAIEKIKQHTRNYAKRQMTWFKRDTDIQWVKNKEDILRVL
jgi:tRNA dimethylallyltransferase